MNIENPTNRIIIRLEFYITNWAPSGAADNTIIALYDLGGHLSATVEFDDGYLQLRYIDNNGNQSIQLAQSSGATLNPNAWNYVDIDITAGAGASSPAGACTLYANGVQVATATGINTSHNSLIEAIGGFCCGNEFILDHFCFYDPTTGPYSGPLPPSRVLTAKPSANGRVNNWTPVGQSTNAACVNTAEPSDSQYVDDDTPGDIDDYALTFNFNDVNLNEVLAVQVTAVARTDDTNPHTFAIGIGNGSGESFGPAIPVPQSYEPLVETFTVNPLTSVAFTPEDLTTLQAAVTLVS